MRAYHLLLAAAVSMQACMPAIAADINLERDYQLSPMQAGALGVNVFADITALSGKCPNAYKHYHDAGWADAKIMQASIATIYATDATWKNAANALYVGLPNCWNNITWPSGKWYLTDTWVTSFGQNVGQGFNSYYGPGNQSGTELVMWEAKWQGTDLVDAGLKFRPLVATPTWGDNGGFGYAEGWGFEKFRLTGQQTGNWDGSIIRIGLAVWDMGECGSIDLRADFFDVGVMSIRGTPFDASKITAFHCTIAGFAGYGTALNGGRIGLLSCDSDPDAFILRKGFGREAGGAWDIGHMKLEDGVTDEARGPWEYMNAVDADGQFGITIGSIEAAFANVHVDAMFVLRGVTNSPQRSHLFVGNVKAAGYNTEVQDIGNGKRYASYGDYGAHSVEWSSENGGWVNINAKAVGSQGCVCQSRLGGQRWNGTAFAPAYDYAACTPTYSYTGGTVPPPVSNPCTYTYSTWSTCTNGTQTRSVTSITPAGCTGTPVMSQPCVSSTTKLFSRDYTTTPTTTGTRVALSATTTPKGPITAQRVVLTSFKPTDVGFGFINEHLWVYNGAVVTDNNVAILDANGQPMRITAGATYATLEMKYPAPTSITQVVGDTRGATLVFTGKLEVY